MPYLCSKLLASFTSSAGRIIGVSQQVEFLASTCMLEVPGLGFFTNLQARHQKEVCPSMNFIKGFGVWQHYCACQKMAKLSRRDAVPEFDNSCSLMKSTCLACLPGVHSFVDCDSGIFAHDRQTLSVSMLLACRLLFSRAALV